MCPQITTAPLYFPRGSLAHTHVVLNLTSDTHLSYNNLGDEGEKAIHDAVSGREGFELEM